MAFRRDSKVDAFQRQITALRHQLGGEIDHYRDDGYDRPPSSQPRSEILHDFPDFDAVDSDRRSRLHDLALPDQDLPRSADPELPAVPAIDAETSIIAHSTTWSGNLESTGSLHVYGRVEGSLTAREGIFVAEEAEVDATLVAANVTVAGKVRGSIRCTRRFEILPHGQVSADIQAPAIAIHEGALLAGDIAMTSAGESKGKISAVPVARAAHGGD